MKIEIGIVLRYKDNLLNPGRTTIEEHNKIIHNKGKVWLDKFGSPINSSRLDLCSKPNVDASLILVRAKQKTDTDTETRISVAKLSAAQNNRPTANLIPVYYRKHPDFESWFCLTSEIRMMEAREAKTWIIAHSGEPLLVAIRHCPKTYFLVTKKTCLSQVRSMLAKIVPAKNGVKRRVRKKDITSIFDSLNDDNIGSTGTDTNDIFTE